MTILTPLASGECLTVESDFQPSSSHVRIMTVREVQPLGNVTDERKAVLVGKGFSVSTTEDGVAVLPVLHPGRQCIVATTADQQHAELCLNVSSKQAAKSSSFTIRIPVSNARYELSRAETMPVAERVAEFKGTLLDPSGTAVPSAQIEVIRRGSEGQVPIRVAVNDEGHLSATLDPGLYMAFFRGQGFRTETLVFEVAENLGQKKLHVVLRVAGC